MKKIFLFLVLFPLFLTAQNIKGVVISQKTNLPVEDVNVRSLNTNTIGLTNEKGQFSLKYVSNFRENDTLEFSHIGYISRKISLSDIREKPTVFLYEEIENLSGLTISANHKLKLKSKLSFNKAASLPYGIFAFGSVLKDDKIYVIGGDASFKMDAFNKIKREKPDFTMADYLKELQFQFNGQVYKDKMLIYDIKTDSWQASEVKFKKRAYHNLNYYNNSIYILGGKRVSANGKFEYLQDQIEVFDTNRQTITIDKTYPHQASNAASFTYKDNIVVMGGSIKANEKGPTAFTNKVHLYDITSGYWYQLADMPTAKQASGILIDNKVYLIGGFNGKTLTQVETFDLTTEKYETQGELFSGLEKPAVTYCNNIIYCFEDKKMLTYNITSKELKEYAIELGLKSSAMYYSNGKLYIIGGYTYNDYSETPSTSVYNISIDEFEATKPDRIKVFSAINNDSKVNP
ncbi:carboxypeptidase-like regulatory domain-containing protein [Flavobacterium sp. N1736]|uniref:Kelch repeat-containing protein n=1 Tax=Flavobacterium sp. N1736 TaxID=2986823 RepID=UPI002225735E|nr:carboxypeptidase-like regulatory domain-containing protein [Flavobacterium sp. N1736]